LYFLFCYVRTIRSFCTHGRHPLYADRKPAKPALNADLHKHFKNIIEILNTDAAPDEVKAMRLLRQKSGTQPAPAFVNCKATVRVLLGFTFGAKMSFENLENCQVFNETCYCFCVPITFSMLKAVAQLLR
jgi:hypothetical protein